MLNYLIILLNGFLVGNFHKSESTSLFDTVGGEGALTNHAGI